MDFSGTSEKVEVEKHIRVWDLPVRLFHWLLVICISGAAITGFLLNATWFQLHLVAGLAAAFLVLARLVWGFTGTTYSRFSSYTLSPRAFVQHVREIAAGHVERAAGHNALGAWMVVLLLAIIAALVMTGVGTWGGMLKQGPLKSLLTYDAGSSLREVHELGAIALLVLVGLHISGAIFESLRTRENLPRAMVTGNKRAGVVDVRPHILARGASAAVIVGSLTLLIVSAAWNFSSRQPLGIHQVVSNASWKEECSSCHMAFPPSLLPAESWKQVMAGLPNHFGEDASLPESKVAEIEQFLVANAAETQDSLPAHRFRKVDANKPLEITATPFWKHMHGGIPAATFARKSIGAPQNCAACHGDAETTALFSPQNISIPEERH